MVRQLKAKPKPTTRSLFCQPELDEESEAEIQSSDFDAVSSQTVKNVMLFSELSSNKEQRAQIELDPPAEIEASSFFHNGVQYSVSARDFSPTQIDEDELPASSSSSSSSSVVCQAGLLIDEWRYTNPLATEVPAALAATLSAPNAAPSRIAPVNHAPAVDATPVAAPPLMLIPGIVPGPMSEPLFPLADSEPFFEAITLGTDYVPEHLPLLLPSNVLAATSLLARVSIQDLSIGLAVLVLGFVAGIVLAATLQAPVDQWMRFLHTLPIQRPCTTIPS